MDFQGELPEVVSIGHCKYASISLTPVLTEREGCGDSLKHNEVGPAIWNRWLPSALANGSMEC